MPQRFRKQTLLISVLLMLSLLFLSVKVQDNRITSTIVVTNAQTRDENSVQIIRIGMGTGDREIVRKVAITK